MTRRNLVSFMKILKLTDDGKNVSIHNRKKRHTEVAELLELYFDTTLKCLGWLLCMTIALVVINNAS